MEEQNPSHKGHEGVAVLHSALISVLLTLPLLVCGVACTGKTESPEADRPGERLPQHPLHTDHSSFFQTPFPDGPSVTRACLECHPHAAAEIMATAHWNWQGEEVLVPGHATPLRIGKRNLINNFCIGIQSNWPACTRCHIGYGWQDANFDFNDPSRVDCLVCHDNSGAYLKQPGGAGVPDASVDLLRVARSVAMPMRQNCGSCHFQGGGGNAVKHGDMDATLLFPSARIDIHMGSEDMQCIDCHRTEQHRIRGRSMSVSVDPQNRVRCTDCHAPRPHADTRLNLHTDRVACQACHIPHMAVDIGTKLSWDWSQAGQDLDITDEHQYLKIKGRFTWAKKVPPEYHWYNETSRRYIAGDRIDPAVPTRMTAPLGGRDDPSAQIWPFKVHRGKQPYDVTYQYFLIPNVHGEQGFWTAFDWPAALRVGAEASGLAFSGLYDFAPTEMYFPLSHMVTGGEQALQCRDCHGARGRLDWQALGYPDDPLYREVAQHEPVYLFDADGEPVSGSDKPLSVAASCGLCHALEDPDFIDSHGYHSSVQDALLPPQRRRLMVDGPRLPAAPGQQMNCFLCHLAQADHAARLAAIASDLPEWSLTATLLGTGLVELTAEGFKWNERRVGADGEAELELVPVSEASCGACHGKVHDGSDPLLVDLDGSTLWTTEKTGQVFSPQRISLSGMNLAGKDDLDMAWDVHAQRLVSCGDCHYSKGRPQRLAGQATAADVQPAHGIRRRCESCHSLTGTHDWLPEPERHFKAVACESCHVPQLAMAAQQAIDDTVIRPDGSALISYRGAEGGVRDAGSAYLRGYRPLLRVGKTARGDRQVLPYNLVSHWYWSDGDNDAPIADEFLRRAWLDGNRYAADVVQVLDSNGDGQLDAQELRLQNAANLSLIRQRLRSAGVAEPTLRGEVRAYHIHHNVRHGEQVQRDCALCHPDDLSQLQTFDLAPYVPGAVKPVLVQESTEIVLDGELRTAPDGSLKFAPQRGVAESYQALEMTQRSQP
jgi:octaheme c-type cytochrome (tetrathionate reductase family)